MAKRRPAIALAPPAPPPAPITERDPRLVRTYRCVPRTANVRPATLMRDVVAGELRVPLFQRPFVWTDADGLALLESLADGIWPGVIVVWERYDMPTTPHQIAGVGLPGGRVHGSWIVDGQQRIGSLLRAFTVPGAFSWDVDTMRPVIGNAGQIPMHVLGEPSALYDWLRATDEDLLVKLACRAHDRLSEVAFTMLVLPSSWTVTDVMDQFRRMNSTGVRFTADELEDALLRAGGET